MADDLRRKGPADRKFISLTEKWEVDYWTKALGISEDKLKQLVAKHGNSAKKIRDALGAV
jgi:uncharacterized protein DUF3606